MWISAPGAGWPKGSPKKSQVINRPAAVRSGGQDQIERVHRRRMCLSHEKIPLPVTESVRNPAGEPVDEPDRSFKTKVGITAHQVHSVYHPAGPGPLSPVQGAKAGAWKSGTCDAGCADAAPFTGGNTDIPFFAAGACGASGAWEPSSALGAAARTMTRASASISRRFPVPSSRIQNRSVSATVRITLPRWKSLPLCHASTWSPTDKSPLD